MSTTSPGERGNERWSIYLVRTRQGSLYTGIATDVARRLVEHEEPSGRGAKYLRGRGPLELVFRRGIGSQALALQVERRVKRLPKAKKEELVRANPDRRRLLALLELGRSGGSFRRTVRRRAVETT